MRFTADNTAPVDDGQGGTFLEGTFELTILEGTGIYKPFAGGHNHMVDKLHLLAPGDGSGGADEPASASSAAHEQHLASPNRASGLKYKQARSGARRRGWRQCSHPRRDTSRDTGAGAFGCVPDA